MATTKTVYTLHYWDPETDEEWQDRRVFTSREVADGVRNGIRMFQDKGDRTEVQVRTAELFEEETFDEWFGTHGPGANRRTG